MTTAERVSGGWAATNTTVAEVERQLQRIMHELSQPATEVAGRAYLVPRAICLNILVHADEAAEATRAAQTLAELAPRHPSRTLLMVVEPDAPADGLDASICTQCAIWPSVGGQLCFEQVTLTARGSTALHLVSVVEPLLVSDLPVILWWLGRPPARTEPLLDLCNRLVVDSAYFPDALVGLAALDTYTDRDGRPLELGDLGWRRQGLWRQMLAQLFDPADARPYLRQIARVIVEYAATSSGTVSAAPLLLLGWLAARLGWRPTSVTTSGGAFATTFTTNEEEVEAVSARLRARSADGVEPGEPLALVLQTGGELAARFQVRRDLTRGVLEAQAVLPSGRQYGRALTWVTPSRAELLARELELPSADPLYTESLAALARLVR
jgi:glucose-6-phosphate dehydrogenase assembly protein OpcA